jgi:hypothetical protein
MMSQEPGQSRFEKDKVSELLVKCDVTSGH